MFNILGWPEDVFPSLHVIPQQCQCCLWLIQVSAKHIRNTFLWLQSFSITHRLIAVTGLYLPTPFHLLSIFTTCPSDGRNQDTYTNSSHHCNFVWFALSSRVTNSTSVAEARMEARVGVKVDAGVGTRVMTVGAVQQHRLDCWIVRHYVGLENKQHTPPSCFHSIQILSTTSCKYALLR